MYPTARNAGKSSEITPFREMDALPPPGARTLVKRKAWGGFWRPLCREVAIFAKNARFREIRAFSIKSVHFTRIPRFGGKSNFAAAEPPETSPEPLFYKGFSPPARGSIRFRPKTAKT